MRISGFTPLLLLVPAMAESENRHQSPNFLFIQCDQLNTLALGCYGGVVPTPNIDSLVEHGIIFNDAICTTPVSTPSRASIVTSQYTHQHGIIQNVPHVEGISDKDITTDFVLNAAGYETHHYGKWHIASTEKMGLPYYPDPYGFGEYRDERAGMFRKMKETMDCDWMKSNGVMFPVELTPEKKERQATLTEKWEKTGKNASMVINMGRLLMPVEECHDANITQKTIQKLNDLKGSDKPFSITCSFIWPHDPNFISDPYYSAIDPDKISMSDIKVMEDRYKKDWAHEIYENLGEPGVKEFLRIYHACVTFIDEQVGMLVKTLKENGQYDNTVIVFTADHGDMMSAHNMIWKSTGSFYKEIVNVPLIISSPGFPVQAKRCDAQVNLVDIMPTFLELAGLRIPESVSGKSLLPVVNGSVADDDFRQYNFCERVHFKGKRNGMLLRSQKENRASDVMVQNKDWKYIIYSNGDEYLYNRSSDPDETRNVAGMKKYDKIKKQMYKAISEWQTE